MKSIIVDESLSTNATRVLFQSKTTLLIPHWCCIIKDLIKDVSLGLVLKGLLLLHLILWPLRCVAVRDSLSQSVRQ